MASRLLAVYPGTFDPITNGHMDIIRRAADIGHPARGAVVLDVNGTTRQRGDLSQLIWTVPEMIAYLSTLFTLAPGDLIFTGTPAGVGPVERGDVLTGRVDGVGALTVRVV